MKHRLLAFAGRVKRELRVYQITLKDARTPWLARILLGAAIGYLLMPVDIIPDAIPLLGQLDDLLIVPGLFWLALRFIPEEVIAEARQAAVTVEDTKIESV